MLNFIKAIWRKIMPLKRCSKDNKSGWKWGDSGTCYPQKDGRERAIKQGVAIEKSLQRQGKPSEFDKASIPSDGMIEAAKQGLELRSLHSKGGENLVVLALAKKIAEGDFISFEEIDALRYQYNKRSRYAAASENTMGYINFLLLGGTSTKDFLNERC